MSDTVAAQSGTSNNGFSHRLNQARNLWKMEPVPLIVAYVATGLLALLVPAMKYRRSINEYQNSYYYQYNQQNQSNDNGNGTYDINNCRWWQWWCTSVYMNENGEYVDQNEQNENGQSYTTPSWFSGWGNGGGSGDRRSGDSNSNSGALKFVYAWQVILFLGLLAYGSYVLFHSTRSAALNPGQSRTAILSLLMLLFGWLNFSFLSMWMLANGSIYTNGREMEDIGGFYNQFSVMMFLSNFWYSIWSLGFCIVLAVRMCRKSGGAASSDGGNSKPGDSMNYLPYHEPSVTVTGVDNNTNSSRSSWLFS